MTTSPTQLTLPRDMNQALRRLLQIIESAPAEIQTLGQPKAGTDDELTRASQLEQISDWLYLSWYTTPAYADEPPTLVPGRDNLASALRASLAASTRWQTGWVAMRTSPGGMCLAGRGKQTRELRPGEYANLARPGMPVAPGDHLAITELIEWIDEPTRYWCARSWIAEPQQPLLRLYFSTRADHVGFVLQQVTETLDHLKLSYYLKCPVFASVYSRVDSLVVYLEAASWSRVEVEITAMSERLAAHLRNVTPPFTKKIAQGVALADDLGTKESFGESRCRALAPAVLTLLSDPRPTPEDALDLFAESLQATGIDPMQPWLNGVHDEHQ